MSLLIFFFVISICLSFLCSIWEAVLLSIPPTFTNSLLKKKSKVGVLLASYKEDIDRPLSAILTLNTIAHTVGAIGVGAQAGRLFGTNYLDLGIFSTSYESIIAGLMTLAILILSEIIPKTLGANWWPTLAPFTVRSIYILIWILWPLVWVSQRITKGMTREKGKSVLSRADYAAITSVVEESGGLHRSESTMIRNLLRLQDLQVRDIMTPRSVIVMAEEDASLGDFYEQVRPIRFSRIPVYRSDRDEVTGLVLKDTLLEKLADDKDNMTMGKIKRDVHVVHDDVFLSELLDFLLRQRAHLAIVVDQFGSLVGLVTMEDLFETIMGIEIMDETDAVADLRSLARKKWEERAKALGLLDNNENE
jgi:CBS domain containing-hemolysin-like protein